MKDESPLSNPSNNGTNGVKKIYLEAALDYNRTFNKVHNVTGTLLYMQKETQWQNRKDLQLLPYRKQSVVARATYGYDNRYMIEASAGMTGSENFSDGIVGASSPQSEWPGTSATSDLWKESATTSAN